MVSPTDIWKLIAGVGIFLFAMLLIENALRQLAGRSFKIFLRKHTTNRVKAMLSGALITGLLQSSSVVKFIMLSFLGAGIVNMRNALAVMLSANFGTTLDSWIVATLGFKVDIESFAFPLIGLGGIALVIFSKRKKIVSLCNFIIGFGLLFVGLAYMKDSMTGVVESYDMTRLSGYPLIAFLFAGTVITMLIQSSSATMVIVLSTLAAGGIELLPAAAVITGAELGTTMKITLGGLTGAAAKKRVALGDLIFNIVMVTLAFSFLRPLVQLITGVFGIADPLIALVLFQSIINFTTLLLFFPFLDPFTRFLEKRFSDDDGSIARYIGKVDTGVAEAALKALKQEARHFFLRAIDFNLRAFKVEGVVIPAHEVKDEEEKKKPEPEKAYAELKQLQGEIMAFYADLRKQELSDAEAEMAEQLAGTVRNSMYAAKCIKDITHNIEELQGSGNDHKYKWFLRLREKLVEFYTYVISLSDEQNGEADAKVSAGMEQLLKEYNAFLDDVYHEAASKLDEVELSTLINMNREIYSADKALLLSLHELIRDPQTTPARMAS